MDRNSGIGLMVFGLVLVVVGAIMRFAVSAQTSGFNIHKAGIILLFVGQQSGGEVGRITKRDGSPAGMRMPAPGAGADRSLLTRGETK